MGVSYGRILNTEFLVGTLVRKQADVDQLKSPHRSPAMTLHGGPPIARCRRAHVGT